jgi:hypothetical protein
VQYVDGAGTGAFVEEGSTLDATDLDVTTAGEGVFVTGEAHLLRAHVAAGEEAVVARRARLTVVDSQLSSRTTALVSFVSDTVLEDLEITDDLGPSQLGIDLQSGTLVVTGGSIHGTLGTAVRMSNASARDVIVGDDLTFHARVENLGIDVIGHGIATGTVAPSSLVVHGSHIVATLGAVVVGDLTTVDVSGNDLASAVGVAALLDVRTAPGEPIDAHGTLLDGHTYAGDILGPAVVTGDYEIDGPNTIRF